MELMHILEAISNTSQLNNPSVRLLVDRVTTYELGAVRVPISLDEFVDISVVHPLRNQGEPGFFKRHTKQR